MEPATVGRLAVGVVSGTEVEGPTIEDSTDDASAVLEEGVGVTSDDDAAVDDSSMGVLDAAALGDRRVSVPKEDATLDGVPVGTERVTVLADEGIGLASEDDNPEVLLDVGTTTIPVGVIDDDTEESRDVSRENVGKGRNETGAELIATLEDAAGDELTEVPSGALAVEGTTVDA